MCVHFCLPWSRSRGLATATRHHSTVRAEKTCFFLASPPPSGGRRVLGHFAAQNTRLGRVNSSLCRTPETPIRLPITPAPRAWGQRPPRARACWLGTPKSCRGAKKVHKYRRNRAPERARMATHIGTHLFVGMILTRERMVSRTNSQPLAVLWILLNVTTPYQK